MLVVRVVALGCLFVACAPATTVAPPSGGPTNAPTHAPSEETCLLGLYRIDVQQRMVQDDGETALLEDQHIERVPVLFAAQRGALRDRRVQDESGLAPPPVPNAPQGLLLAVGAQVTETLTDLAYVPHPDGAKPTQTTTSDRPYTFFLAEAAWSCEAAAAEVDALGLPRGEVGAAACVPAAVRAKCTPVDFTAK
jgi:hypothetical protein